MSERSEIIKRYGCQVGTDGTYALVSVVPT
jgi:hypothetical protein